MVAWCEVLSFHTDSDFCAAYQSYMTNQQELSENDDILHLLPNQFPEKCYNTVEIFTSIFPNCSFCCNFQSWFPDIISVVISRPRENFPVTVSSVPHTSLQPLQSNSPTLAGIVQGEWEFVINFREVIKQFTVKYLIVFKCLSLKTTSFVFFLLHFQVRSIFSIHSFQRSLVRSFGHVSFYMFNLKHATAVLLFNFHQTWLFICKRRTDWLYRKILLQPRISWFQSVHISLNLQLNVFDKQLITI